MYKIQVIKRIFQRCSTDTINRWYVCSLVLVAEHCLWHEEKLADRVLLLREGQLDRVCQRKAASILWDGGSAVQRSRKECTRHIPG